MTCQPDWHEIFAKCKNNPEKNIIFNKKKLVLNFDFYWCYLRNALWFGIVRLNHEEPLKFAPFCPFLLAKLPLFWPLISRVLPLFEMWQLCMKLAFQTLVSSDFCTWPQDWASIWKIQHFIVKIWPKGLWI